MDAAAMGPVSGIGGGEASARVGLSKGKAVTAQPPNGSPMEDTVELSPVGIAFSQAEAQSRLRSDRIREVRAEIRAGVFETSERMDGTVERLIKVVGQVGRAEAQAAPNRGRVFPS